MKIHALRWIDKLINNYVKNVEDVAVFILNFDANYQQFQIFMFNVNKCQRNRLKLDRFL